MIRKRRATWLAACYSGLALGTLPTLSQASGNAAGPAQLQNVSIQVVNPDAATAIRVFLDGKVIFDAVPVPSSINNIPSLPAVAGSFSLASGIMHELTAEVADNLTRARLVWTPRLDGSSWLVVFYYPGRPDSKIPPFFTMALQDYPHKLR